MLPLELVLSYVKHDNEHKQRHNSLRTFQDFNIKHAQREKFMVGQPFQD